MTKSSAWTRFQKKHAGEGKSPKTLGRMYRQYGEASCRKRPKGKGSRRKCAKGTTPFHLRKNKRICCRKKSSRKKSSRK